MFRLGVPRSLGGAEAPLPELLETIEALATADSAAAWCAMIGVTTGILAARLPSGWAQEIYGRNPNAITVGAIAPTGRATRVEGGVRVTGTWRWGSGIHNADWVVGGTVFPPDDEATGAHADAPDVRIVFFRRNEVEIADDWHTSGMRGTGSNSFRVEGVRVPAGRWASIEEEPRETGALYRFNIWSLLALGRGGGAARHRAPRARRVPRASGREGADRQPPHHRRARRGAASGGRGRGRHLVVAIVLLRSGECARGRARAAATS